MYLEPKKIVMVVDEIDESEAMQCLFLWLIGV